MQGSTYTPVNFGYVRSLVKDAEVYIQDPGAQDDFADAVKDLRAEVAALDAHVELLDGGEVDAECWWEECRARGLGDEQVVEILEANDGEVDELVCRLMGVAVPQFREAVWARRSEWLAKWWAPRSAVAAGTAG